MDFTTPQHWIDTYSTEDWNALLLNRYWQECFSLSPNDWVFDQQKHQWNTQLLTAQNITEKNLARSLMYLTNTTVKSNPDPAIWALKHMKSCFPDVFGTELAYCVANIFKNAPHRIQDVLKIGISDLQASPVLHRLAKNDQWEDILVMLEFFAPNDFAPNDSRFFHDLKAYKKELYKIIGFIDSNPADTPLKMDWFYTAHIQKNLKNAPLFEEMWGNALSGYPHPQSIRVMEKFIQSDHHSVLATQILLKKVLNTPLNECPAEFIKKIAENDGFYKRAALFCAMHHHMFTLPDVMQKFFSFANLEHIEYICENINKIKSVNLGAFEKLCEWASSDFHASITKSLLLTSSESFPNLHNNIQKFILLAELNDTPKPKNRKM